jgi:hypothetical protein
MSEGVMARCDSEARDAKRPRQNNIILIKERLGAER